MTKDWKKSFDCFGAMSLACDLLISVLKAALYLEMTGLKPAACPVIADALCVCCFCIAFYTCALLFFVSFKSANGVKHVVVRWVSLSLSFTHICDSLFLCHVLLILY